MTYTIDLSTDTTVVALAVCATLCYMVRMGYRLAQLKRTDACSDAPPKRGG